jgi:Na+/H+-translocating membrane pyrophosphatase
MEPCPNCGRPVEAGATICPDCGASTRPTQTERLLTGTARLDAALGFVAAVVALLLGGIGLIAVPVLYFVLRHQYPAFVRGLRIAMVTLGALLLGALAICIAMITQGGLRSL